MHSLISVLKKRHTEKITCFIIIRWVYRRHCQSWRQINPCMRHPRKLVLVTYNKFIRYNQKPSLTVARTSLSVHPDWVSTTKATVPRKKNSGQNVHMEWTSVHACLRVCVRVLCVKRETGNCQWRGNGRPLLSQVPKKWGGGDSKRLSDTGTHLMHG